MSGDALFELGNEPGAVLTAAERRFARIVALAALGQHPLAGPLNTSIRLHPQAGPVGNRDAPGLRCGTCVFRRLQHGGARDYPKCTIGGRASHGERTDVRGWWSACVDYIETPAVPPVQPVPRPRSGAELQLVADGVLIDMAGRPLRARACSPCGVHLGTTCPRSMYCPDCGADPGKWCQSLGELMLTEFHGGRITYARRRDDERQAAGDPHVAAPWPAS